MGDDGEHTPAEQLRAHRRQAEDGSVLADVIDEIRGTRGEMRRGFAAVQERLAKGDTALALFEERQSNQGTSIASLTKRLDGIETMVRALACEDCEERIEKLEKAEAARIAVETDAEKRRTWQPPWWLLLLGTGLAGVVTAWASMKLGIHTP